MDFASLAEKVAFFDELDALNRLSDGDDTFSSQEQEYRAQSSKFFGSQKEASTVSQPSSVREGRLHPPRRTLSASVSAETSQSPVTVIEATPGARQAPGAITKRLFELEANETAIKETPIPNQKRPLSKPLQRSATVPLEPSPATAASLVADQSSSTSTFMRKRKRQAPGEKSVPESEQIFKTLSFYYIPNDDVAPMRKLRIGKAKQYGARWVRDLSDASHVIVDKRLSYKDIQKILTSRSVDNLVVINEEYPIDCIAYRTLLNPNQQRYSVSGFPAPTANAETCPTATSADSPNHSLPLKEPQENLRRWDHVPRNGTQRVVEISQTQSSAEAAEDGASQSDPRESQHAPGSGPRADELIIQSSYNQSSSETKDELSEYIQLMRQYKDLPLDDAEEDDSQSVLDGQSSISGSETDSGSEQETVRRKRSIKNNAGKKAIAFEDQFACNRGGTLGKGAHQEDNPNARTIEVLQSMCNYYTNVNDHWRTMAYRRAISTLRRETTRIMTAEEAYRLPSIGSRLAAKIEEIVTTNALRRLDYAREEPLDKVLSTFLGIYGVGTNVANRWVAQGLRTLEDLLARPPPDLTPNQRLGVEHYDDLNARIPRTEVTLLGACVRREAARIDPGVEILIGGSYRRGSQSSGDIDIIVTKKGTTSAGDLVAFLEELLGVLTDKGFLVATLAALHSTRRPSKDGPGSKWHGCCILPESEYGKFGKEGVGRKKRVWRRIDFLLVPETEYGAALIYFTGNDIFNRSMRLLASKKGMRLNQRGLYREVMRGPSRAKVTEGELVEGRDEKRIFEILGVKWREPWERWC